MKTRIPFSSFCKHSQQYVALKRLAEVPAGERGQTRVLEFPGGRGMSVFPLYFAGFDVTAGDLFPEDTRRIISLLSPDPEGWRRDRDDLSLPPDLRAPLLGEDASQKPGRVNVVEADMEKTFPFDDHEFDWVVSLEGIEHIDGQMHFIRECRRVLKPGGRLMLSTPNPLCLRSRLAFAFTGQRTLKTFIDEFTAVQARDGDRIYHGHVFLIDYFELRYLLHNYGFRIKRLYFSYRSVNSMLLAPLLLPFIAFATLRAAKRQQRRFTRDKAHIVPSGARPPFREMVRHVLSVPLLFSGTLMLEAERQEVGERPV